MESTKLAEVAAPEERTVLMRLITRRAEREYGRLATADRRKVTEALRRSVLSGRCTPVKRLARFGVSHFDVNDSLRVSYRLVEGQACVLHIGTHAEFNKFARRYDGSLPREFLTIEESKAMNKRQSNGSKSVNTSTAPAVADIAPPAHATPAAALAGEAGQVVAAINALVGKLLGQVAGDIETMAELVRGQATAEQQALADRLSAQQGQLEALKADTAGKIEALAGCVAEAQKDCLSCRDHVRSQLAELQERLATRVDEAITRAAEERVAPLSEQVTRLAAEHGRLGDELARQSRALEQQRHGADSGLRALGERVGQVESHAHANAATTARHEAALAALAQTAEALSTQVREATEELARLKASLDVAGKAKAESDGRAPGGWLKRSGRAVLLTLQGLKARLTAK
jgi:hypothetical protein